MDAHRFDDLTRRLATRASRRGLLKTALAGLVGGAAVLRGAGSTFAATPCTSGRQCPSRVCVDGFCCNGACTGQCEACNLPGREGVCSPVTGVPIGNRQACPGAGPCKAACDGQRRTSCAAFPGGGIACGAAICRDGWQTTYACGGNGTCHPTTTSCGLFVCDATGTACLTTCTSNTDCVGAAFCANGVCQGDGPLGQPCISPDQCQSGLCVDGVCCVEGCDDPCRACNVAGNLGFCADVADGAVCDDGDPCTTGDACRNGNCHGTPVVCPTCQTCRGGTCAVAADNTGCGTGHKCCGGTCTDVTTTASCGACGHACAADQGCCGGACRSPEGETCVGSADCCPGTTCAADQGGTQRCCAAANVCETAAGPECCASPAACSPDGCCASGVVCDGRCCPNSTDVCSGGSDCCASGIVCEGRCCAAPCTPVQNAAGQPTGREVCCGSGKACGSSTGFRCCPNSTDTCDVSGDCVPLTATPG